MPKITFRHIFSITSIILGGGLECYYYFWRFLNDGVAPILSIIIGLSLTLLLALAVFNRKYPLAWVLMVALLVFSVLATSAGQSFSLNVKITEAEKIELSEKYQTDEINNLIVRRRAIDKELSDINEQINKTVNTLQDRAIWRTALKVAEDRKSILSNERENIETRLNELYKTSTQPIQISAVVNIYDFYSKLFGVNPERLQFILHTILSVFIALMSPIGLITYPRKEEEKIKRKYKKRVKKLNKEDKLRLWVEQWVHANWMGVKTGSREILSHIEFDKFCIAQGYQFSEAKYRRIFNAANKKIVLDGSIILCYSETEAVEKIMQGLKEKKEEKKVETGQKDLFEEKGEGND